MPYIKDTFSILAECAAFDLPDTNRVVRESEVRTAYSDIEEAETNYVARAEMVPVIKIGEGYYTETQFLAPFMRDAEIKSMSEALDIVAEANKLPAKSVGILVESEDTVTAMIEKACCKGAKAKDVVMGKIGKATELIDSLKKKGHPVKRKPNKVNESTEEERAAREKERQQKIAERDAAKAKARAEKEEEKKYRDMARGRV